MLGNINITAGESTFSQEQKTSSGSLGGSVGNNGSQLNIGMSESDSSLDYTTVTNSTITANKGSLVITSNNKRVDGTIDDTIDSPIRQLPDPARGAVVIPQFWM